jgi:uncharacterized membrane protein
MKRLGPLNLLKFSQWFIGIFSGIGIIAFVAILFNKAFFNWSFTIDTGLAAEFGSFFGGLIGTLFGIISVLLIILTLFYQFVENNKNVVANQFFKMLDYHNDNVNRLNIMHIDPNKEKEHAENRRAFVIFKLQLKELLEITREINKELKLELEDKAVIDIAYISFYYGIDDDWPEFLKDKLKGYPNADQIAEKLLNAKRKSAKKIGRTNQTSLSAYFRNMYNAIKLVDENKYLTKNEKLKYIKILRAQLSNPELYVLYFNLMSRFGTKWKEKEYITKYEFLKNLPSRYCDIYDPKKDFPMKYEEEEINP